jgi:hypothetical protein
MLFVMADTRYSRHSHVMYTHDRLNVGGQPQCSNFDDASNNAIRIDDIHLPWGACFLHLYGIWRCNFLEACSVEFVSTVSDGWILRGLNFIMDTCGRNEWSFGRDYIKYISRLLLLKARSARKHQTSSSI